ncbi:hypothetical protein N5E02_05855 [Stenotrophomonas sp. GD03777]|uniref:hypothetical protein n=1 Tax=Stenotrophomonas sp. GD03777 TaxID=2975380 RepID=UPI00244A2898|nr:hypothetical protein [Stenotrophomonas sp. GD03777]MDH1660935.1 hypothetical protein [Stenotrophomonas sp. GD03777]
MSEAEAFVQRLSEKEEPGRQDYEEALGCLDEAVCEAVAVGQAQAGRMAGPCMGYATYVFARMCAHGTAAVRAAPLSRWVESDHAQWGFHAIACHARAILEGNLFFHYLISPTNEDLEEGRARITLLQLNDCCSRVKMFVDDPEQLQAFERQRDELIARLKTIPFFQHLAQQVQSQCLSGKKAWFLDRAQLVEMVGMKKAQFDVIWDLWSQHSHIHPMSFYRMEANGRGSGLDNAADRSYLITAMLICAEILKVATDRMVEAFPDVANVRQGLDSKFSPGPKSNRPK